MFSDSNICCKCPSDVYHLGFANLDTHSWFTLRVYLRDAIVTNRPFLVLRHNLICA